MKLPAKNMSIGLLKHSTVRSGSGVRTIQPHGPQSPACRTPACKVSHSMEQRRGLPQGNQNLISHRGAADLKSQSRASRSGTAPGAKTANYNVLTPTPLGHGSQQIRATIHGTPQLAGSVDIRAAGFGKAYISNLRVDQQHRRRGVAAKLIDAAVSAARRQGFKAASLEARPSDNGISPQALVAMYRRQGFRSVGRSARGCPMMERKL